MEDGVGGNKETERKMRERGVGGFKERRSRVGIWLEVVANVM